MTNDRWMYGIRAELEALARQEQKAREREAYRRKWFPTPVERIADAPRCPACGGAPHALASNAEPARVHTLRLICARGCREVSGIPLTYSDLLNHPSDHRAYEDQLLNALVRWAEICDLTWSD